MRIPYLKLFLVAAVAALAALALTPLAKALLTRLGVVDMPSARRINKKPIPRGGGTALVASFAIAVAFGMHALGLGDKLWASRFAPYALIATAIIVLTGLVDDIKGVKPITKLLAQVAAASVVFIGDVSFGHMILFSVPPWLDFLITIGWFVIIVNAFNLIDGLDGLASGLAIIGASGLAAALTLRGNVGALLTLFALGGACAGFLRYNYNPATIFLGDTGSLFIGFVLALTPLVAGGKAVFVASVGVPLLVVGLPLFDTVLAILRRSARAMIGTSNGLREVVLPDVEHLHHRLLASGMSQRRVAGVLYAMAFILVLAAVGVSVKGARSYGTIILGVIIILGIIGRQLTSVELWYVGNALNNAATSLPRKLLAVIYVALDILVLLVGWYCSAELTLVPHIGLTGLHMISEFPFFFVSIFVSFAIFRIYHRRWDYSQGLDYFVLLMSVLVGWLVAYSLLETLFEPSLGFERRTPVFLALISVPLLGIRMMRVVVRALLASARRGHGDRIRAVVYGSGIGFFVLYALFKQRFGKQGGDIVISAVVDDEPTAIGSLVQGFRVNDAANIDAVIRETGATAIVLAKGIRPKKLASLAEFASGRGLLLKRFSFTLRDAGGARRNQQESLVR